MQHNNNNNNNNNGAPAARGGPERSFPTIRHNILRTEEKETPNINVLTKAHSNHFCFGRRNSHPSCLRSKKPPPLPSRAKLHPRGDKPPPLPHAIIPRGASLRLYLRSRAHSRSQTLGRPPLGKTCLAQKGVWVSPVTRES